MVLEQVRRLETALADHSVRVMLVETYVAGELAIDGEATGGVVVPLVRASVGNVRYRVRLERWGSGSLVEGTGRSLFEALGNSVELATRVGWFQ